MLNNWKIKSRYLAPFLTPNKVFMGHSSPQHTHKKTWIAWRPENTASRSLDTSCSFTEPRAGKLIRFSRCVQRRSMLGSMLNRCQRKQLGPALCVKFPPPEPTCPSLMQHFGSREACKSLGHCRTAVRPLLGPPCPSSVHLRHPRKPRKGELVGWGPTYKPQHTSSPQTPTTSTYIGLREGQGGRALTPPRPSGRPDNSKGSTDVKDSKVRGQHLSLGLSRSPSRRVQLS